MFIDVTADKANIINSEVFQATISAHVVPDVLDCFCLGQPIGLLCNGQ